MTNIPNAIKVINVSYVATASPPFGRARLAAKSADLCMVESDNASHQIVPAKNEVVKQSAGGKIPALALFSLFCAAKF